MGFGRILFAVFMLVPLIEIAFFVVIGNAIGLWPTLAGVLITAIVGSLVLRYQGMAVFNDIRGPGRRSTPFSSRAFRSCRWPAPVSASRGRARNSRASSISITTTIARVRHAEGPALVGMGRKC
jgi:hypothetical protein